MNTIDSNSESEKEAARSGTSMHSNTPAYSLSPSRPLSICVASSRIGGYINVDSTTDHQTSLVQSVLLEESMKKPPNMSGATWMWIFLSADDMQESKYTEHCVGKCFACNRKKLIQSRITITHRGSGHLEEWMRGCLEVAVDSDRTTDKLQQIHGNYGSCCAKKIRAHFLKGAFLKQHLLGEWAVSNAQIVRAWESLPGGV